MLIRLLPLCLLACGGPPSPWEDATPTERRLSASFRAAMDQELPGPGAFTSEFASGDDMSQAFLREAQGAKEPVVQIRLLGRTEDGWNSLEIDVASSAWQAGSVTMDGSEAIGLLTRHDGELRYVLGTLEVSEAGMGPGEVAAATITDAVLAKGGE